MTQFGKDVQEGLTSKSKYLSSKYFYDKNGDELFQKIMAMDEYYLTRAELSIFENKKDEIGKVVASEQPFRLIELGAGDGAKTQVLLKYFIDKQADFIYCPVDISRNVIGILSRNIQASVPKVQIEPLVGDYFEVLKSIKVENHKRNVVFFLGSNIGNFTNELAISFLSDIRKNLNKNDLLMIGFDLKKDPTTILNAYNDKVGITRDFNLNLLVRINSELGGNFEVSNFRHYPTYDPLTGECTSFLISLVDQEVFIKEIGLNVTLKRWEPIKVEISRKFSVSDIHGLANQTGFEVVKDLFDSDDLFTESIWAAT